MLALRLNTGGESPRKAYTELCWENTGSLGGLSCCCPLLL